MTDNFTQLLEESGFFNENLNMKGIHNLTVTDITNKFVIVDLEMKSEGYIPLDEFRTYDGNKVNIEIGEKIPVFIDSIDNGFGQPIISYTKAIHEISKEDVKKSHEEKEFFIEVYGSHSTNVGLVAKYHSLEIFLPFTLLGFEQGAKDYFEEKFLNKSFKVKVIKYDFDKNHIVASHRAYLENEKGMSFDKLVKELEVGQIHEVPLKVFKKYGVFTSINHIDTLLKVKDIGWTNVENPSEVFDGQKTTKVMITQIDHEQERINISHKLANTAVWDEFVSKHEEGDTIKVDVINIKDDYLLVRYNNSIDFILHQHDVSNQQLNGALVYLYEIGETIEANIKTIDNNDKKVKLTVKEMNDDNSDVLVGDVLKGKILSADDNGMKVGYSHLVFWIPKSKLTDKYNHREIIENAKNGSEVEFKVIEAEPKNYIGTLVIGDNIWDSFDYEKGQEVDGFKVAKINKHNVLVENELGMQGYLKIVSNVHINMNDMFSEDEELSNLIFKSKDKNNYLHFEIHIDHKNDFKNPTLKDVIN